MHKQLQETVEQLQETVEVIRVAEYHDLDAGLVAKILEIERDHFDRRSEVLDRLGQAIDAFLDQTDT